MRWADLDFKFIRPLRWIVALYGSEVVPFEVAEVKSGRVSRGHRFLSDGDFDALFTTDKPVIFAYHGYPWLIHRLAYKRHNHDNMHVRGYQEEGSTTTPFDMVVRNRASRYHLVMDVLNNMKVTRRGSSDLMRFCQAQLARHEAYIVEHLEDMPEVRDWELGEASERQ